MVPDGYTGSSINVALGQELGPQGNDVSLGRGGDIQVTRVHDKGSLDLLAAYWINVLI